MPHAERKYKILVIDDILDNCLLVQDILARSICQVEITQSPNEGLRQIMVYKPDLVLLDLDMPELNGYDMLSQIRKMEGTRRQAVMMFTSHNDKETVTHILDLGVSGYLVKPFKAYELIQKLEGFFQHSLFHSF